MCLYVDPKNRAKKTAAQDIPVWKVISRVGNLSYHRKYEYEPNVIIKLIAKLERTTHVDFNYGKYSVVKVGFHAWTDSDAAKCWVYGNDYYKVVKMIVPKGAHYYIGEDCDIVSDRLSTGSLEALVDSGCVQVKLV